MTYQVQRRLLAGLVIMLLVSLGCVRLSRATPSTETQTPSPSQPSMFTLGPGDYDFTLEHDGLTREYLVHIPPSYTMTALPLLISFHGGGGDADSAESGIGGLNAKSDLEGFIVVYPLGTEGLGDTAKEGRYYWNAGRGVELDFINYAIDDVGFIESMLDSLEGDFAIDPKRIYATGISNGAWMSYALACRLSDRMAAIAPVAGGLVTEDCSPSSPVSIMHFHGVQDPGWPYYGGGGCWTDSYRPPIQDTITAWLELNACEEAPQITYQRAAATCETYNCAQDTEVTFCTIEDGGHTYPGGEASPLLSLIRWDEDCALGRGRGMGGVSESISALDEMWTFFEAHPKD